MVLPTNGSDAAIKYLYEAFVAPGDAVALTDPSFAMYPIYANISQARILTAAYGDDLSFPEATLAAIVNPNNPTGVLTDFETLERLAQRSARTGTLFVVDEAYGHFAGVNAVPLIRRYPNVVVLRTFSKAYGLASQRLGFLLADQSVIEGVRKVKPSFDVSGLAVRFGERLLDAPEILEAQMAAFRQGKAYLLEELDAAGIAYRDGAANFLLLAFPGQSRQAAELLRDRGILVASNLRHPALADHIRVTVRSEATMRRFVTELTAVVDELRRTPAARPAQNGNDAP